MSNENTSSNDDSKISSNSNNDTVNADIANDYESSNHNNFTEDDASPSKQSTSTIEVGITSALTNSVTEIITPVSDITEIQSSESETLSTQFDSTNEQPTLIATSDTDDTSLLLIHNQEQTNDSPINDDGGVQLPQPLNDSSITSHDDIDITTNCEESLSDSLTAKVIIPTAKQEAAPLTKNDVNLPCRKPILPSMSIIDTLRIHNYNLKVSLMIDAPEPQQAVNTLRDVLNVPFSKGDINNVKDIVYTLRKVKRYKGDARVRSKASEVYNKIKDLFTAEGVPAYKGKKLKINSIARSARKRKMINREDVSDGKDDNDGGDSKSSKKVAGEAASPKGVTEDDETQVPVVWFKILHLYE
jgi:hypothetical protein